MTAISGVTLSQTAGKALGGTGTNQAPVRESAQVESTSATNVARASQGSSQETIARPIKNAKEQTTQIPPKVQNSKDNDGRSEEEELAKDQTAKELKTQKKRISRYV